MAGFRKHGRTMVKCAVKLTHDQLGDIVAETRDISETGVFVWCKNLPSLMAVGDEVEAELHSECDMVTVAHLTVVRLTDDGVGLTYG